MKILGIDYGRGRVGVAYSEGLLPSPLAVIRVKSKKQVLSEIAAIAERLAIEKIVLGLSGGRLDKEVLTFAEEITAQTNIPVDYIDETLSSKEAVGKMVEAKTTKKKRKVMEDAVAATIILNTYLEQNPKS